MRHIVGIIMLLGISAAAQAQETRGVYAGVSLGYFNYEEDGDNIGAPISESTASSGLLGGYQFNSVYALELGWGRTGTFTEQFRGFDQVGEAATLEFSGEYEITTLRFMAFAPFANLAMFGGGGYFDATLDASVRFDSSIDSFSMTEQLTDDGLTVVGGIQYEFNRIALRGAYEWFDTDNDVEAQGINVTALFRF